MQSAHRNLSFALLALFPSNGLSSICVNCVKQSRKSYFFNICTVYQKIIFNCPEFLRCPAFMMGTFFCLSVYNTRRWLAVVQSVFSWCSRDSLQASGNGTDTSGSQDERSLGYCRSGSAADLLFRYCTFFKTLFKSQGDTSFKSPGSIRETIQLKQPMEPSCKEEKKSYSVLFWKCIHSAISSLFH